MNKILSIKPLGFPWQTRDPFLFCAYHRDLYPKGNENLGIDEAGRSGRPIGQDFMLKDGYRMYHGSEVPGFPYHPHRGFETITINKEGIVDHSDSLGAAGRFGEGDVQWMTAGKGILHSEMFPLIHKEKENPLEIFQVWLNLPKAKKFVEPHFKMLWKDMIPIVTEQDDQGRQIKIDLIAGTYGDTSAADPTPESWAADPENGVVIMAVAMDAQTKWLLPKSDIDVNSTIYFYKGGSISIDDQIIESNHLIEIDANQDVEFLNGREKSFILVLQGKPINEPVAQHGPFVMNTPQEIQEAFAEYRQTQFGGWPWPMQEQVHPREKGRFALHANGTEELKA